MADTLRAVRYALRSLRRTPGFSLVAVLSIALGVGANTSIFTLLDQVLLRVLPVPNPDALVLLTSQGSHYGNNRGGNALSYPMYEDVRDTLVARGPAAPPRVSEAVIGRDVLDRVFTGVFSRFPTGVLVSIDGQAERAQGEIVSGTFFPVLGVKPARGRLITPDDDREPGAGAIVVLGYDYWQRRFGGDEGVVGKTIRINEHPFTVIGVSERGFFGVDIGYVPDIRMPMMMKTVITPGWDDLTDRRSRWLNAFGRLAPGVTPERAKASLQSAFRRVIGVEVGQPPFAKTSPETRAAFLRMTTDLLPAAQGRAPLRQQLSQPLVVLMAAAAGVLLIACANVAGLLVARSAARQREIAVRVALGAGPWQVVRPMLVESVLVGLSGGALGVAFSIWTTGSLLAFFIPPNVPTVVRATPDLRVLGFALAASLASAAIFGLAPAIGGALRSRADLLRDRTAGGTRLTMRRALVVAQLTLSMILLVGAGVFVRSLRELRAIDLGVRTENVVTFRASPFASGYTAARSAAFYREALARLRARPGVAAAGLAAMGILEGNEWDATMTVDGHQPARGENRNAWCNTISPGYFATMGMTVKAGRDFRDGDTVRPGEPLQPGGGDGYHIAIANERFVKHYFPDGQALGRHVGFGADPGTPTPIEIVGIVSDAKYEGVRNEVPEQLFFPFFEGHNATAGIISVRAAVPPESLFALIRETIRQIDANVPVFSMRTLDEKADQSLANDRLIATLASAFGLMATVLAVIGLYAVMSFSVTQRTKEVGIRVALGARGRDVLWLVTREAAALVTGGLILGVAGALALARLISHLLYDVSATDPATIALAAAALGAIGLLAGLGPARRAARLDPLRALRDE